MKTKIRSFKFIAATIFAMATIMSPALASTWCHGFLKANDGTEIQIDYQVGQEHSSMRALQYWSMEDIYVHAKRSNFTGHERVSIVFTTAVNDRRPDVSRVAPNVPYDGTRYTASLNEYGLSASGVPFTSAIRPLGMSGGGALSLYHFEVAIVIDGHWLVDPVTNESNFKFFADRYSGYCANPY